MIKVTKEHIAKGIREDTENCPIAIACREAGYQYVWVGGFIIILDGISFWLPNHCQKFVGSFDEKLPVDEIEIDDDRLNYYYLSDEIKHLEYLKSS